MARPLLVPLALLAALPLPAVTAQDPRSAPPPEEAAPEEAATDTDGVTAEDARAAARVVGLAFTEDEIGQMLAELTDTRRQLVAARGRPLGNAALPALRFDPLLPGMAVRAPRVVPRAVTLPEARRPDDIADLVFADIPTLAALIRSRQVSCAEVVRVHLERLGGIDADLHCVVTLMEASALARAEALDAELAAGRWRGLLHGVPWGAKDLLATRDAPTTWGAAPFAEQHIEEDATVVRRLDEAGAVLVAKLSLGALAYGDVWFGGTTRNPWRPEQGSSGSSAGPAAAVVAGGVTFAIGSETYGSIVSPSHRCGASSLRPTFGRVSRHGAMALCWSLDKLGPMARSVQDTAIVLAAIAGPDGHDPTVRDAPYTIPGDADVTGLRVGYPEGSFDAGAADDEDNRGDLDGRVLDELASLGVELVPVTIPAVDDRALNVMLMAEAAAAFEDITLDGRDDELTRQDPAAWPNLFRAAQLLPAVAYVQASRRRARLMREMDELLADLDALVHPTFSSRLVLITNHTGHPTVVAPAGFRADGTPYSVSFTGHLYDETTLLALAQAWQRAGNWHTRHPDP